MSEDPESPVRKPPQALDRRACLERLGSVAIGRVAWATPSGVVVVVPVNFVVDGPAIVFSTGPGDKLTAIREGRRVSFQADDIERALHTGWSVLVTGIAQVLEGPEQVHRIEQFQLDTWAFTPDRLFVRLSMEEVTGRVLPLRPGGATVERPEGWPGHIGALFPDPAAGRSRGRWW